MKTSNLKISSSYVKAGHFSVSLFLQLGAELGNNGSWIGLKYSCYNE